MATWSIHRTQKGTLKLTYRSARGGVHECGESHALTAIPDLVTWIVTTGEPAPGDLIRLPDGGVLQYAVRQGTA